MSLRVIHRSHSNPSSENDYQGIHNAPPPSAVIFLVRVDIEGLVHGNFTEVDAESVLDDIEKVPLCLCASSEKRTAAHKSTGRSQLALKTPFVSRGVVLSTTKGTTAASSDEV